ncbi:hypothetical protein [Clavibacter sp. VKM Ac-2542]|uniref:hypothetical protein n=1 Tax=Clavibacter sp. VKM Ac-2542 TaxID=2783811 RepID=UPI00188BCB50|nr:hypothetical protein [Clavibacter sp. VKM Ac-2542]MBF4622603.1 hypothetical protein [Clavibacter sp. VKM Ac-2542]
MTTDEGTLTLRITLGHFNDDSLNMRFDPVYSEEIISLLDDHDIDHNTAAEFSAGPPEWIEVVQVLSPVGAAGIWKLASVITAFSHRHEKKRLELEIDGNKIDARGYSAKDVDKLLKHLPEKQKDLDAKTREVLGDSLNPDT